MEVIGPMHNNNDNDNNNNDNNNKVASVFINQHKLCRAFYYD